MASDESPADPVLVGAVVRPRGIAGEVIVEATSADPVWLQPGATPWVRRVQRTIVEAWPHKGRWVVLFEGIGDRDAAESLRGAELELDAALLQPPGNDRYWVDDLIGCRLEDAQGRSIGTVRGLVQGNGDWLDVDWRGSSVLVPMAKDLLVEVDIDDKRIVMDLPEGLLEASAARHGGGRAS